MDIQFRQFDDQEMTLMSGLGCLLSLFNDLPPEARARAFKWAADRAEAEWRNENRKAIGAE
jgi:hypothetical protein